MNNIEKLTTQLTAEAVRIVKDAKTYKPGKLEGTYHVEFDYDEYEDKTVALVVGWSDGFDDDGNEEWNDFHEYELCMKIAEQPSNSVMQCDYDIDWLMPCYNDDGEVCETEVQICDDENSLYRDIAWMLENYYHCKNEQRKNRRTA